MSGTSEFDRYWTMLVQAAKFAENEGFAEAAARAHVVADELAARIDSTPEDKRVLMPLLERARMDAARYEGAKATWKRERRAHEEEYHEAELERQRVFREEHDSLRRSE